jgi:ribosomal protein S18 acetylase RimI-like enzyme
VSDDVVIRRAEPRDVPQVAVLAAELVRMHHRADPARFLIVDDLETGYGRWLSREVLRAEAAFVVACRGDTVLGYAYGSVAGRDWMMLLDAHGAIHDIFVAEAARRSGIGRKLMAAIIGALETLGARLIVLSTMSGNEAAQRLFRESGFRPTMLEMTR